MDLSIFLYAYIQTHEKVVNPLGDSPILPRSRPRPQNLRPLYELPPPPRLPLPIRIRPLHQLSLQVGCQAMFQ